MVFNRSVRRPCLLHPPNDPHFYNVLVRSRDQGKTWNTPRVVRGYDWYGVECAGLTVLHDGRLMLNQWRFKQMFYHAADASGLKLVAHPQVGATAFTGSKAGLHLKQAADQAGKPIYLEMSSINPIFVLPGVLAERSEDIAQALFASCTLDAGQFCTNPGLIMLLAGEQTERFIQAVQHHFEDTQPGILLTARGPEALAGVVQEWESAGAERVTGGQRAGTDSFRFENMLYHSCVGYHNPVTARCVGKRSLWHGVSLIVVAQTVSELLEVTACLDGNLTGSVYSHTRAKTMISTLSLSRSYPGKLGGC